jgi:hypothetical protein
MTYVPGFEWDIFISYPMEAEVWTRRFVADLMKGTVLPAAIDPKVYFAGKDWNLGGTSIDMLDAARNSALFVAVLTRDSLSDRHKRFLQQEMDNFQKSGIVKGRFCPIPLYPIDASQLRDAMPIGDPEAFWNTNLTFFYKDDGIPLLLDPSSEPNPGEYQKRVQKAAYQLRELLEKLRKSRSVEARINRQGPFEGKTVFLARKDAETYIEREWQSIRSSLLSDGATVVPSETDGATREGDVETLRRADLFVQLFHGLDRLDDAKAQFSAAEAETENRTGKSSKRLSILQWRKKQFNAEADSNFIRNLPDEDRKFCQSARTGTLEEFKLAISDELQKLSKPPPVSPSLDSQPYLYITADGSDRELAIKLQARARIRTLADVMTRDETQQREDFVAGLTRASGIVFLYGNADAKFIEAWSKEFIRNASLSKLLPKFTNRKWLYLAPPEKGQSGELMLPFDLRVEGSQTEFTLEGIEKICEELCGVLH